MAIEGPKGNLKRLRTAQKLTQKELADLVTVGGVKCSVQTIGMIEAGGTDTKGSTRGSHMSIDLLKALAKVFKATVDELIK